MLRLSSRVCGSYLLNQRVIADWWQPRYRERMHNIAKEKLNAALQESTDAGRLPPPSDETELAAEGTSSNTLTESTPSSSSSSSSSSQPPLSLYDANALVATFVSNHNTADLSSTLQYIREHLGQELAPYHFHALLRNFSYHHDTHNALQLLEVMVQSGTMTLETYARIADCIHALSPPDAQARLLQLVSLAQEAFGGQTMLEDAGSEGATAAQYSYNEEGRQAREAEASEAVVADAANGAAAAGTSSRQVTFQATSAPLLSSLLYHLSTTQHTHTVASCFVVALWIRALGVELSDWDVLTVLTAVTTRTEQFPRLCMLFGHLEGFERGHVSVQAVLDRLVQLGEVEPSAAVARTTATASSTSSSSAKSSTPPAPFTALVNAMRDSLYAAGGTAAMTATVAIPFMNAQTNDVEQLVWRTLQPLLRDGVGAHGYSAAHLLHALSLVSSTVRDDVGGMEMLMRSIREQEAQAQADARTETTLTAIAGPQEHAVIPPASSFPAVSPPSGPVPDGVRQVGGRVRGDSPTAEPFAVPVHHLIDMGSVLNRMSASTLRAVQRPFRGAIRRLVSELPDTPLGDDAATVASAASIASCHPPIPTTRDVVKLSNYETQFIRTVAEAREVLRSAVDSGNAAGGHGRLPGSTQLMFFQLAEFCCRHPPRNPKLTPAGLEERVKWARYLDARDTSLALFGSARQSRDSMKHLFYHDNQLPALRSDAVIAKDFADVHGIFFGAAVPQPSSPCATQAELQQAMLRTRTTLPHAGSSEVTVPRYLWDPTVYNPYPAAHLANNDASSSGTAAAFSAAEINQQDPALDGAAEGYDDSGEAAATSEFFVELWHALLDKTTAIGSNEVWYLQNTGMYLLLTRCLLHRLDWEAAVHLTRKMSQHASYNYMMDHELTTIFKEIGDPAGCLAFKVATKLFDGRITKDGQAKRAKYDQEQYS